MDHLVTERQAPDNRGELVMKKKWFVIMMLLVSLLAAGCGRDEMPARIVQATEPSVQVQCQLPQETMAARKIIAAGRTHTVGFVTEKLLGRP